MPAGVRTTSVRTDQPEEISVVLGAPVLEILEYEANAFGAGLHRTEFARLLLRKKAKLLDPRRSEHAKTHAPLANIEHERARLALLLPPVELGILIELCNVLGLASKSTVMAHLILDWAGISPLRQGFEFDVAKTLKNLRVSGKPVPRSTKLTLLQLAPAIHDLLDQEAQLLGMFKAKDVLATILNARIGDGGLSRPEYFPHRPPLGNVAHEKKQLGVYLPAPHKQLLGETSRRLGGGEHATIASHFILEWLGISPLSDGYEFQGTPEQTASRARTATKRTTTKQVGSSQKPASKKKGRASRTRRR